MGSLSTVIVLALLMAAGLATLGWYLRVGQRAARPVAQVLPPPDIARTVAEAYRSFQYVRRRAWNALLRGCVLLLAYVVPVVGVGCGLFYLFARKRLPEFEPSIAWWETLSPFARYAGYFVVIALMVSFLIGLLYQFRIMMLVREGRPLRGRDLTLELDLSIGRGGLVATSLLGAAVAAILAGWFAAWAFTGLFIEETLGLEGGIGPLVAVLVGAVGAWILSIPLMLTFAVLATHDPGWLSALEASIGVAAFRRPEITRVAGHITLLASGVYYWPAAIWMILDLVDNQMPLITVLLQERRVQDVLKEVETSAPAQEGALKHADRIFESGRYLDALNMYQMSYFRDPMNLGALARIARAQLHIGNWQKGREALERLLLHEPTHADGLRMMEELRAGRWYENGDLFQEANARSKQHLGKGVELRDTITPEALKDFEKPR